MNKQKTQPERPEALDPLHERASALKAAIEHERAIEAGAEQRQARLDELSSELVDWDAKDQFAELQTLRTEINAAPLLREAASRQKDAQTKAFAEAYLKAVDQVRRRYNAHMEWAFYEARKLVSTCFRQYTDHEVRESIHYQEMRVPQIDQAIRRTQNQFPDVVAEQCQPQWAAELEAGWTGLQKHEEARRKSL